MGGGAVGRWAVGDQSLVCQSPLQIVCRYGRVSFRDLICVHRPRINQSVVDQRATRAFAPPPRFPYRDHVPERWTDAPHLPRDFIRRPLAPAMHEPASPLHSSRGDGDAAHPRCGNHGANGHLTRFLTADRPLVAAWRSCRGRIQERAGTVFDLHFELSQLKSGVMRVRAPTHACELIERARGRNTLQKVFERMRVVEEVHALSLGNRHQRMRCRDHRPVHLWCRRQHRRTAVHPRRVG